MAHVGDEVATNALDPARLCDVVDERGRADDVLRGVPDRHGGDVEHTARRAEECQLVLAGLTAERSLDEPFDGVLRERVAVAGVAEPFGREVPDDLVPVGVDDEHAVGERVERTDDAFEIQSGASAARVLPNIGRARKPPPFFTRTVR